MAGKLAVAIRKDSKSDLDRALKKSQAEVAKLEGKLKQVGTASKTVGKESGKAFGGSNLANLKSTVAQFVGIGAAIGVATRALREFQSVKAGAAETIKGAAGPIKTLNQISGGDPERLRELLRTTKSLSAQGIPLNQAASTVFSGTSLGFSQEEIKAAGRFMAFTTDIQPILDARSSLAAAFGPQAAGGSLRATTNALLAGAEKSKISVVPLSKEALQPAASVRKLGGTAVETIAAVSLLAKGLKSAEEASTATSQAANILARDKRLKGGGLLAGIEFAAGLDEKQLTQLIGKNVRAEKGIRGLVLNLPEFRSFIEEIKTDIARTGPGDRVAGAIRVAGAVTPLRELRASEIAFAQRQAAEAGMFGGQELTREAIENATFKMLTESGVGGLRRFVVRQEFNLRALLGDDLNDTFDAARRMVAFTRQGRGIGAFENPGSTLEGDIQSQQGLLDSIDPSGAGTMMLEAAKEIRRAAEIFRTDRAGGPALVPAGVDR